MPQEIEQYSCDGSSYKMKNLVNNMIRQKHVLLTKEKDSSIETDEPF
jgi:hypothetical protein